MKTISRLYGGLFAAVLLAAVMLCGGNALLGDLNQDEGWYLYAAGMVARGFAPYRDFAFTQGPVLPWVYALFYGLVRAEGVLGARVLTACFGLIACGLAALLAARLVSKGWKRFAALTVFMLLGLNAYHAYFSTIVKTYSLCNVFMLSGLLLLVWTNGERTRRDALLSFAGGFMLALASGTRLSAGAALAVTGCYLLVRDRMRWTRWVLFGVGGVAGLALVFGRSMLYAPVALRFGLLEYHAWRTPGGIFQTLVYKLGFISRMVQGYTLPVILALLCVALLYARRRRRAESPGGRIGGGLLWAAGVSVSLVHLSAPFPYDDYQVMAMPVLAAAVVCSLTKQLESWPFWTESRRLVLPAMLGMACLCAVGSSPILQDWMVAGRDRIWWKMKDRPDVLKLRDAGRFMREQMGGGDGLLLTQDTYLAVEADAAVPRGMEMGPFCYYPDFSLQRTGAVGGVLNREAFLDLLKAAGPDYAAFSGYGLSIRSPDITELTPEEQQELIDALNETYEPVRTYASFGQGHTTLVIYHKKQPVPAFGLENHP